MRILSKSQTVMLAAFAVATFTAPSFVVDARAAGDHTYVGVKKCKMCHKKEATGNQYGKWMESKHAKAFETLKSPKALEAAKKLGIDDPTKAEQCLKCHVTAYPVLANIANEKITLEEGVSCESCHGPGSDYYKKKTMQGIADGTIDGGPLGFVKPTKEVCIRCHEGEGNPFQKPFDFDAYVKKIAHPNPARAK